MYRRKYQISALLILPMLALFFNGCVSLQKLPEENLLMHKCLLKDAV
ncbi:unnamed protein product, partial [marine sediment metagenome]